MLLGREQERLALDRLLAEARDGRSGVLALVGEPGIGKTSLLDYAANRAQGMSVLRARGIESEAEVPFAGLAELLQPALGTIERIPPPQATALAGALALAPATAGDRFAIGAATLSLLSAYAEDKPLAVLVDDIHRLDGSTSEALLFAARRLVADPIAVVLACREGEPSLLDGADLRVLRVPGLDRASAAEMIGAEGVPADAAERLFLATGGNPLALRELAGDASQLAELPGDMPLPISASIADAFARRAERLPEPTRRMLLLAAASGNANLAVLARAASELQLAAEDLVPAEEAGLVRLDQAQAEFVHPLARSAIYARAPAPERRAAHAALAGALPDRDVDARAWHLAAASVGPNDAAADALEQAGMRARQRSAYAVAAGALERAGRLTTDDGRRGARLFASAEAAWLAGDARRTLSMLDEAQAFAQEPAVVARIDELRGEVAMRRGPVMEGSVLLVSAAERIAETEPAAAIEMLAQAVGGAFYAGDTRAMVSAANKAAALADRPGTPPRAAFFVAMSLAMARVADGDGEGGIAAARRAVEIIGSTGDLLDDPRLLPWTVRAPLWIREAEAGRELIEETFERARRQGAVGVMPSLLHHLARDQATTDRWAAAEASYDEGIRLARETDQRTELGACLAGLAWLLARQGREDACRDYAREATAVCRELGLGLYGAWAIQALGDLELGAGRPVEAVDHYRQQLATLDSLGIADVDVSAAPELVEAHLRLGRRAEAGEAAVPYIAAAERKGQPWALARAARCRGLLAGDDALDPSFQEALDQHALTPDVFEAARTQLAYGSRLRRARQRVQAREYLRAAHETFDRLGAARWADQAAAELAASGEKARRRDVSTLDDLTPQELQIASLLAEGKTTREAAAAVFLSPKTIEYHLRHVYRKLGISSRAELAATLGDTRARDGTPAE
jgi:DNA-binding CsgD family transcriptional regulator